MNARRSLVILLSILLLLLSTWEVVKNVSGFGLLNLGHSAASPADSARPSTIAFTPSASPAPKLALNPNPFTARICASDPCSPKVDPNAGTYNAAFFGGTVTLGHLNQRRPGTDANAPAPADVVLYTSNADPSYSVRCTDYGGCGTLTVHIHDGAHADYSAGDYQLNVINKSTGIETAFWEFNDNGTGTGSTAPVSGGGSLKTGFAGQCSTTAFASSAPAFASNTCTYMGGTATGLPFSPNQLDPVEVLQRNIPHDLQMLANCTSPHFVAPAVYSDGRVPGRGCPPEGEILWLDLSDAQIEALSIPRWAKTLYHNLHDYGWILENSGPAGVAPNNSPSLQSVSDYSWTLIGQPSQWNLLFQEIEAEGSALRWKHDWADVTIPVAPSLTVSHLHWLQYNGGAF